MKKSRITLFLVACCSLLCMLCLGACSSQRVGINLNDYVAVTFDGYNGTGTATAKLDTDALVADHGDQLEMNTDSSLFILHSGESLGGIFSDYVMCQVTPSSELSNGDSVTVQWLVDVTSLEDILNCDISYSDINFTVDGLEEPPRYVTSLDEIPDDVMDTIKSQAEDVMESKTAEWDKHAKMTSLTYDGDYLLCSKELEQDDNAYDADPYNTENILYLVYKVSAEQTGKKADGSQTTDKINYYWYIGFNNIIKLSDGEFDIDYQNCETPEYNRYILDSVGFEHNTQDYTETYEWDQEIALAYDGYETEDEVFNGLVKSKLDAYTYEGSLDGN